MMLLTLAGVAACAGAPRAASAPIAAEVRPTAAADDAEPMLDRVEGEDTRWVTLPNQGECPFSPEELPAFEAVDDTHVPAVDPQRERQTNMDAGDESLDDRVLLMHLDAATTQVLGCLSMAACYDERSEPAPPGEIEFAFEVDPAGRVRSVDVEPSAELDRWGVTQCARRAIFDTEFPAYDGADMVVSYRLEID